MNWALYETHVGFPPKNAEIALLPGIWDGMAMLVWRKCHPTNYNIIGTNTLVYLQNVVCTHRYSDDDVFADGQQKNFADF